VVNCSELLEGKAKWAMNRPAMRRRPGFGTSTAPITPLLERSPVGPLASIFERHSESLERRLAAWPLLRDSASWPPSPLAKGKFDPFEDKGVDFGPLFEGHLPQALINGLGQIQAGVNDPGPRLSAYGLPWAA